MTLVLAEGSYSLKDRGDCVYLAAIAALAKQLCLFRWDRIGHVPLLAKVAMAKSKDGKS